MKQRRRPRPGPLKQRKIPYVLRQLVAAAPSVLSELFTDERMCVNATAVARAVLNLYAIPALPMVTQIQVQSDDSKYVVENGPPPYGYSEDGWDGHLVLIAMGFLLDLSVGQFSRPDHGIEMQPTLVAPVPPGFVKGASALLINMPKGRIGYVAHPNNKSYEPLPGWSIESEHNQRATLRLASRMGKSDA